IPAGGTGTRPLVTVRVGIAQFAPVPLDLDRSVTKAIAVIRQAGKDGIKLLAFPETWLPTYPFWCDLGTFSKWGHAQSKKLHARLAKNSLEVGSKARSLYNTLFFFDDRGALTGHHRKLVPTF